MPQKILETKGLPNEKPPAILVVSHLTAFADVANNTIIKIEQGENENPTLRCLKENCESP